MACPYCVPDTTESEAAAEGTLLHDAVHQALLSDNRFWAQGLEDEQIEAVEFALEVVDGLAPGPTRCYIEEQWPLTPVTGEQQAVGTCDVAIVLDNPTRLIVADHKFGRAPVSAEHNAQLQMYACAIIHELDLHDVQSVELVIIQPRLKSVSRWSTTLEDLVEFAGEVATAVFDHGDGEYNPGEVQCKYCARAGKCEAQDNAALASVVDDFPVIDSSDRLTAQLENAIAIVPDVSPDHLGRMLKASPLVFQWLEAINRRAMELMSQGQEVPGFKLVAGRLGPRKWIDEQAAAQYLSEHLDESQVFERKVVSPTKAEKLLPKDARDTLGSQVERAPAKPQLAPASDKRPALDVTPLFSKD
jgi:hypothetical protein